MPKAARKKQQSQARPYLVAGVLGSVVLAVLVAGLQLRSYLLHPSTLPVKSIQVKGELRHLDRAVLQQTVADAIDGGFFAVDIDGIHEQVRELSWVDRVSVRRVWPDKLIMQVTEQKPFARWGKKALVNPRGDVFKPEQSHKGELISLYGPEGSAKRVVAFYKELAAQLAAHQLKAKRVGLDERREWVVDLYGGLKIMLGQVNPGVRFQRFMAVYPSLAMTGKEPKRIDLRYEHGFAVYGEKSVAKTENAKGMEKEGDV